MYLITKWDSLLKGVENLRQKSFCKFGSFFKHKNVLSLEDLSWQKFILKVVRPDASTIKLLLPSPNKPQRLLLQRQTFALVQCLSLNEGSLLQCPILHFPSNFKLRCRKCLDSDKHFITPSWCDLLQCLNRDRQVTYSDVKEKWGHHFGSASLPSE